MVSIRNQEAGVTGLPCHQDETSSESLDSNCNNHVNADEILQSRNRALPAWIIKVNTTLSITVYEEMDYNNTRSKDKSAALLVDSPTEGSSTEGIGKS